MKEDNLLKEKTKRFAVRIYNLYKYLTEQKTEYVMSKQILRSGTSIGANVAEAVRAESDVDFIHKLSISRKECEETIYWLELLFEVSLINEDMFESMSNDGNEILKIETSIIKSIKNKIKKTCNS